MAFGNHPNGGTLVFGIDDDGQPRGVDTDSVSQIVNTLANLGRDAIDPPLAIDHAVVTYEGVAVLLVRVPEQTNKPVHRRGKTSEESWLRSGGTTRKGVASGRRRHADKQPCAALGRVEGLCAARPAQRRTPA